MSTETKYTIEADVPIPARARNTAKYPWDSMSAGDSFFVPCREGETPLDTQNRVAGAAWGAAKRRGFRSRSRIEGNGCRVWFVEASDEQ